MSQHQIDIRCPWCGRMNQCHDRDPGDEPVSGDVSLCWACQGFAIYMDGPDGLTARRPTDAEAAELRRTPAAVAALTAVQTELTPHAANDRTRGRAR